MVIGTVTNVVGREVSDDCTIDKVVDVSLEVADKEDPSTIVEVEVSLSTSDAIVSKMGSVGSGLGDSMVGEMKG